MIWVAVSRRRQKGWNISDGNAEIFFEKFPMRSELDHRISWSTFALEDRSPDVPDHALSSWLARVGLREPPGLKGWDLVGAEAAVAYGRECVGRFGGDFGFY